MRVCWESNPDLPIHSPTRNLYATAAEKDRYANGSNFDVKIQPGNNLTLNYDMDQFNVESWPGVTIQHGILTWGHNATLN